MLLSAQNLTKTYGPSTLFRGVSLSIEEGERLGFIGPNGAGKSTLLKILAGLEPADSGIVSITKGMRAVYVPQQDEFPEVCGGGRSGRASARDVVEHAALRSGRGDTAPAEHELGVVVERVLSRLGFDEAHGDAPAAALSGGWRKRLSIARALARCGGEPELLLLDEPTNHLDLEGIRWLEELLRRPAAGRASFAAVFVTHDRVFLETVATRVLELSAAYPRGTFAVAGNYSEFLRRREDFLAGQARAEQSLANQVRRDVAWLSRGAPARTTKQKARIQSSHARMDELAGLKGRNSAAAGGGAGVDFAATGRKTRKLLAATGLAKALGGRALFRNVDLLLGPGDCLGLLGPNGSGKTTLLRVLTGELAPDAGTLQLSEPPPRIVRFSQHREGFPPQLPLAEALSPAGEQVTFRGSAMHITAWARRFLFREAQLEQPVHSLSGGELARAHIARMMLEPADILVLDEPTNDLDIPTLEVLEESLEDFPGALVLVTHDRAMLARLSTQILALDGRGGARLCASLEQALEAQAQASAEARGATQAKPPARPAPVPQAPQRKKLTYSEQREHESIEARIHAAEAAAAALEARLGDPAISSDHVKLTAACHELEAAQAAVQALYARWEELEERLG